MIKPLISRILQLLYNFSLKKNFFLKLKDMEKITKQIWEKNDLPENLYELLMEKYNYEKSNSTSSIQQQKQDLKSPNIKSESEKQNETIKSQMQNINNTNQCNYLYLNLSITKRNYYKIFFLLN